MMRCREAVPVWIMPLSRVADNCDPRTTGFDVVIIDEASQCDVMGLLARLMAEKAIFVGAALTPLGRLGASSWKGKTGRSGLARI
jgi:hypothetical protein